MSIHDQSLLDEAKEKHAESVARLDEINARIKALPDDAQADETEFLRASFEKEQGTAKRWAEAAERTAIILTARAAVKPQQADNPSIPGTPVSVGKEPLTYERHRPENSFFRDLVGASRGDIDAQQRLQRHSSEMRVELRDISSAATAGGEFIPPLWLQNQWVELLRANRPTADAVQHFPLPPGTNSINLPRLATGTATAVQTADNAAVQETDATTNSISAGVKTIAGQQDMSRQLFEFSQPGLDEVLFRDLARDYATKLDVQILSGTGSAGQALGIRNVASILTVASGATATAAALFPKIADAIQRINSAFLRPDTIVMHPRRWGFFLAALDTQNRPLFNAQAGPFNAMGTGDGNDGGAGGTVGNIQGVRVILDPNLPTTQGAGTNEDVILVFDSSQMYLWEEGSPRSRVFEDIGSGTLTVRLSVWGYFAFMAGRYPSAIAVITGTALVPPTF